MICTFFGHRDTPRKIEPLIRAALVDLIENHGVDLFYVGHHGGFDIMVKKTLKILAVKYPHIQYYVVLAYIPGEKTENGHEDFSDTLYPDGLEAVPPRYAISRRNEWMVDHADFVITYVKYSTGGAANYKRMAEKKGKVVINLAE